MGGGGLGPVVTVAGGLIASNARSLALTASICSCVGGGGLGPVITLAGGLVAGVPFGCGGGGFIFGAADNVAVLSDAIVTATPPVITSIPTGAGFAVTTASLLPTGLALAVLMVAFAAARSANVMT